MKLVDMKVVEFNDAVASNSPAPGGGSVSALASTFGTSLLLMCGLLTSSKKKFIALDEHVKNAYISVEESFKVIQEELITLVDKDTEAFNMIMNAFKLPKSSEDEVEIRNQKIVDATLEAIKIPYRVAELSYNVLKQVNQIIELNNKNTISDLGVGVLMIYAGLEGAAMNVKINLSGLTDVNTKKFYTESVEIMILNAKAIKEEIISKIHNQITI